MNQWRKKPVVFEAFQMTQARSDDNSEWPEWLHRAWNTDGEGGLWIDPDAHERRFVLGTKEGVYRVSWDDWIIKGVRAELYACKPDVFEMTYERVMGTATMIYICPHGSNPSLCPQCLMAPKPEYEWRGGGARPFKCPCCDGWGQREVAEVAATAVRYEACRACSGSGLVWAP